MDFLPKEIENIILDFKIDMEKFEKLRNYIIENFLIILDLNFFIENIDKNGYCEEFYDISYELNKHFKDMKLTNKYIYNLLLEISIEFKLDYLKKYEVLF